MSRFFNDWYFSSGEQYIDTEYWVPIPCFENYGVCARGYVINFDTGKILKDHRGDIQGHRNIRLNKNGKTTEKYLHRLVASAFIPNNENYPIVRHLDGDVENLAWGTQRHNWEDSVRHGNARPFTDEHRKKSIEKTQKPILCTNLKTGKKKRYPSQTKAARDLKLQQANVGKVLYKQRKHTGGYYFEFE